jgi:hypothetical protein
VSSPIHFGNAQHRPIPEVLDQRTPNLTVVRSHEMPKGGVTPLGIVTGRRAALPRLYACEAQVLASGSLPTTRQKSRLLRWPHQCLEAGDHVEQLLVDAALTQTPERAAEILEQFADVSVGTFHCR